MKLNALAILENDSASEVFGPKAMVALANRVTLVAPRLAPPALDSTALPLETVELLFTGWGFPTLDVAILDRFPRLQAVFHAAGSVKRLVSPAFWERGIRITSAARMNAIPVAEFTFAQIIFCLKHGWQRTFEVRAGTHFRKETPLMPGAYGSTVGLISLGHTGRLVAERLRTLDVEVIGFDPYLERAEAHALGIDLCSLDDLFRRAHVVSCHTPLLPETTGMIAGRHFSAMRPGASFINTARGAVVRESEMLAVLRERPDLFAVLDVTDPEPPLPDSLVLRLPNVVVTPHIAGSLGRECQRMGQMMIDELDRYLAGVPLEGEIRPVQLPFVA
ncbi:MAG: hydroxyacid dehydrogenase [Opitutaceae bacterium]